MYISLESKKIVQGAIIIVIKENELIFFNYFCLSN